MYYPILQTDFFSKLERKTLNLETSPPLSKPHFTLSKPHFPFSKPHLTLTGNSSLHRSNLHPTQQRRPSSLTQKMWLCGINASQSSWNLTSHSPETRHSVIATFIQHSNINLHRWPGQCDSVAATRPNQVEVHSPTLAKKTFMFTKQKTLHKP